MGKPKKAAVRKTTKKVESRELMSQAVIISELAGRTELTTGEIRTVFNELQAIMDEELFGRGAPRQFTIPFLGIKFLLKAKPALPEREGRNPATGETMTLKPRPASWDLKMRKLKAIKEALLLMEPPEEDD